MARAFSTTSTYIRHASGLLTATPLTLACWFNVANITADHTLMSCCTSSSNAHYFRLVASGAVAGDPVTAGTVAASGEVKSNTSTSYSANTWQHACAVFASATSRTSYLNGGGAVANTSSSTPSGINRLSVGMLDRSTPVAMSGSIAFAAAWDVALGADEVLELANGVSPAHVRPASRVFYLPLIRNVFEVRGLALTAASSDSSLDNPRIYL